MRQVNIRTDFFMVILITLMTSSCAPLFVSRPNSPESLANIKQTKFDLFYGPEQTLNDYRGKIVLLNFWASWCKACRQELLQLEAVHRKFENMNFVVLAILIDENTSEAEHFIAANGITYPVGLLTSDSITSHDLVPAVPFVALIDRSGDFVPLFDPEEARLAYSLMGPRDWSNIELLNSIEKQIKIK